MVLAAAPITEKARMVFLTSGATSPRVPIEFPNYYFMACFGDNTQAAAGAEYAFSTLGAKTAYLLFDETTDYTVLLAGYFKERYQQLGGQIVAEPDTYVGGATDFSAQIAKIKALATPPDMLYVSSGPDEIGTLVKQLREAGIDEPVFGGDGYDTPLLLQTAGDAANDVYFTTHALFDPTQATQRQKEFIDAYQTRFGTPPESAFAGLGYDAVKLLAAAIEHGSAKQKAIPGALEATQDFPGVTGDISFAPGVHIPEKQVTVVHVQGGR